MKRAQILMSIFLSFFILVGSPGRGLGEGDAKAKAPGGEKAKAPGGEPKAKAPAADDAIPKRPDFTRYTAMVDRSPFAVATAPTQVAGPPAWSKDLFIANAGHTPEMDSVTISSLSDKNMKEYISTEKTNEHGYGIANIEWSDTPGGTKVTISKDGQFATIGFNEALTTQPLPQVQPPPGATNMPPGVKPQPAAPQPALPAPHVRGMIQRTRQPAAGLTPAPVPPNPAALEAPDS